MLPLLGIRETWPRSSPRGFTTPCRGKKKSLLLFFKRVTKGAFLIAGILKRWQLIFYGTQPNPIRLKSSQPVQAVAPFAISQPQARSGNFPFGGNSGFMLGGGTTIGDILNLSQPSFRSISELFASGTEPEVSSLSGLILSFLFVLLFSLVFSRLLPRAAFTLPRSYSRLFHTHVPTT